MSDQKPKTAEDKHRYDDEMEKFLTYRRSGGRLEEREEEPPSKTISPTDQFMPGEFNDAFDRVPLEPEKVEYVPPEPEPTPTPPRKEPEIETPPYSWEKREKDNSTRNVALWSLVVALAFFVFYLIFLDQKPNDKNNLKIDESIARLEETMLEAIDGLKIWFDRRESEKKIEVVKPEIIYKDRVVKKIVKVPSKPKVIYRDRIKWKTRTKIVEVPRRKTFYELELEHREKVLKDFWKEPLKPGEKRTICFGEWRDNGCYAPGTLNKIKHQVIYQP